MRGVTLDSGAKAMLLRDNSSKSVEASVLFTLAVMSASKKFSWKLVKKVLKVKNMRFATPEEVHEVTGCLPGARLEQKADLLCNSQTAALRSQLVKEELADLWRELADLWRSWLTFDDDDEKDATTTTTIKGKLTGCLPGARLEQKKGPYCVQIKPHSFVHTS